MSQIVNLIDCEHEPKDCTAVTRFKEEEIEVKMCKKCWDGIVKLSNSKAMISVQGLSSISPYKLRAEFELKGKKNDMD